MAYITLASINIEHGKHLPLLQRFLNETNPDVLCMQEVPELFLKDIMEMFGAPIHMTPHTLQRSMPHFKGEDNVPEGIAIGSKLLFLNKPEHFFYSGTPQLVLFDSNNKETYYRGVLYATILKDSVPFTIATTHHTWTHDGNSTVRQIEDTKKMLEMVDEQHLEDIILCGDFNAPRMLLSGTKGEVFEMIASRYTDNIPQEIMTTLDQKLHRSAPIPLVVDGLFTSSKYHATSVQIKPDVSDHCAIIATIHSE